MTLFELSAEYRAAHERMEESGFDAQTIADTLDGLVGDFEAKAIAVAKFARNLEAEADAISDAIKAMHERASATANRAGILRKYLMDSMVATGIRKVACPYFVVSVHNNPPAVIIEDEDRIPQRFWVRPSPPPMRIDKVALKNAIKAGEKVPGAHIESSTRVDIK